jgi:hypothetical protein
MKARLFSVLIFISFLNLYCQEEFQNITVKEGDTLWSIANKYLKDPTKWDVIVKYNNMKPEPSAALPGMTIKVPINLIKEEYRAAKFIEVVNDVRFRREKSSSWNSAVKKAEVYNGDAIRSNSNSMADIKFYTGQILNVFPNSMLIVRSPKEKNNDIRLMSGEIRTVNTRVITPSARIIPKTTNTEFGAKINDDLSTKVEVYKGEAKVESKNGSVDIKEGFTTQIKLGSSPSSPVKMDKIETLQDMKTRISEKFNVKYVNSGNIKNSNIDIKANGEKEMDKVQIGEGNVKVDVKGKNDVKLKDVLDINDLQTLIDIDKTVSGYRLQISRSQDFSQVIFDKKYDVFTRPDLRMILSKGMYWIRYAYIDLLGFQGEFSQPKKLEVK